MEVRDTELAGVKVIVPRLFEDARGFFFEAWNARDFAALGIDAEFVQDNHSRSGAGALRGLHYQVGRPQGKLIRITRGAAFDVVVDLRRASPTFGRSLGVSLSEDVHTMLWVPPGFAHGFLALRDDTEILYKCTDYYAPTLERTLLWSDPALGIAWPFDAGMAPILSPKDAAGTSLAEAETFS